MNKQDLIDFEKRMAARFDNGEFPYLVHFSGGNEDQLLSIFQEVKEGDWIFSTHRSHYHYLLAGGSSEKLENFIATGRSMYVFDKKLNFYSSSILASTSAIAAGIAKALKMKGSDSKVWCFIGDGAEDEGYFSEAVRYVDGWDLPCTFIVEDNDRSVAASKALRWGKHTPITGKCVRRYHYEATYPHGGSGTSGWLDFKSEAIVPDSIQCMTSLICCNGEVQPYLSEVKHSMEMLAYNGCYFLGYNVAAGDAYGTLKDVSMDQRIETPVAENLMIGLAAGMSLLGYRPVVFFERHDFIYNALDALLNEVAKIQTISQGEYNFPIIIRAVAGSVKPFYAGPTHTSDLTELFKVLFPFPVYAPWNPNEVLESYKRAFYGTSPVLISERKEWY